MLVLAHDLTDTPRPSRTTSSGRSLGEKELDAYEDGVRGRLKADGGDFWLPKSGCVIAFLSSMRAASEAEYFGVSSPSGVMPPRCLMQHALVQSVSDAL